MDPAQLTISDLDRQIETLSNCQIIKEAEVKVLCMKAKDILMDESNVQRVDAPVTVALVHPCNVCDVWLCIVPDMHGK